MISNSPLASSVVTNSVWITGSTRSGKTSRLIEQFQDLAQMFAEQPHPHPVPAMLVFAANGDNRIELADQIAVSTQAQFPFDSTTPLGFFQSEVILFWPLLAQQLDLKTQFPLRLRPETEQELATRLWQPELEDGRLSQEGVNEYYLVRRSLDLLQLAASGGIPTEDIASILKDGLAGQEGSADLWDCIQDVLLRWQAWCLERGLLTYGIISQLYWRYLLPHPTYQQQLKRRYRAIAADDVDEYPAIARFLFEFLLDQGIPGVFSYNPDGAIRLGLGADPEYLSGLAARCQVEMRSPQLHSLSATWGEAMVNWIQEPLSLPELPDSIYSIQTISRAQLLRQTAEVITTAIHSGQVQPQEVAVIGPGLDAIARYTLREILTSRAIAVESLNDQQPLNSSPMIRALLTLMAFVYPGLGHLINRDAVSEMLVVLSQTPSLNTGRSGLDLARIDPVRSGLLTDHCYLPDAEQPRLIPANAFPRWDRLGYQATSFYADLLQWVETQQLQQQQRLIPNPVVLLDRATQRFLSGGSNLPYDQLAALRELMETAQHYWEVDNRLRQADAAGSASSRAEPTSASVGHFIQLLRDGTITADPFPTRPIGPTSQAVTLATIFQYRSNRRFHRWQFWLDAGSALWLTGGGPLFGAPLFLQSWSGRPWTAAEATEADQQRLQRQILDLLGRVGDRIYLCHSELATNGQEQNGPLLSLANSATAIAPEYALEIG
ncbi:MAG: recombinase family protein [Leptolyngbyaceae cyanobacterium RM1_406_9]|nr:recombinase family protein [Leptolyngbyaceae cyanobacterium RM1_406_9]